ncbi:MAG: hypothetical protein ACOCRX_06750 [Candidatus Woesearchaeota archaeon]
MNKKVKVLIFSFIIVFSLFFNISVSAQRLEWRKFESDNFIVFFPVELEYQARETIYHLENQRKNITKLTSNKLDEKIAVIIEDKGQFTNAFADPINNKIGIFTYPPGSYSSLATYENHFRLLNKHELTHLGHLTKSSELSSINKKLFGNLYSPNLHSPLWLIEGTAVYSESQLSPYSGRLNGGYYDAIYKVKATEGKLPSLAEITYNHNHFPSGHQYLYGAKFVEYLNSKYGEDNLRELFDTYASYFWSPFIGDVFPGIGLDLAAKEVYGSSFSSLYSQWKNDSEANQSWEMGGKEVYKINDGYISNLTAEGNNLYFFEKKVMENAPFTYRTANKLIEYDLEDDSKKVLKRSLANNFGTVKVKNDKVYYLLSDYKKGFNNLSDSSYGIVSTLYSYNLKTAEEKKILSAEICDFIVDNNEILYAITNKDEFGSKLISYKNGEKKIIASIPVLISEMKSYKDKIIIVAKNKESSWDISLIDKKSFNIEKIIDTPYAEKMISINDDKMLFTANYEGKEEIYSYNLINNNINKLSKSSFAQNGIMSQGKLYFTSYNTDGMAIYSGDNIKKNYKLNDKYNNLIKDDKTIDRSSLDIEITNEPINTENLAYLLKPGIRFLPFYAAGEDAIGYNSYELSLSPYSGFNLYYQTKYLNPLNISFNSYLTEEKRNNEVTISYPLYRSKKSGLSNINSTLSSDFSKYFLGLNFDFNYPYQELDFKINYSLKDNNYKFSSDYSYLFNKGKISNGLEVYNGIKRDKDIREFIFEKELNEGNKYNIDFSYKLAELRNGLWNPNIFIGDIYTKLFVDYEESNSFNYNTLSGGGELLFESGLGNYLHFVPRLGMTVSEDKRKIYLGFESNY